MISTQISTRLEFIIKEENVNATDDGKQALIDLAQGDMRKVLNILQSVASAFDLVNECNVYKCCGIPTKSDIETILDWLLTVSFSRAYQSKSQSFKLQFLNKNNFLLTDILELQHQNGYALQDILQSIHTKLLSGNLM